MLVDSFRPQKPNNTVLVSAVATPVVTPLPAGGDYIRIFNSGAAVIAFVELYYSGGTVPVASVTTSMPVPPGVTITRRKGVAGVGPSDDTIAVIASAAGPTSIYVTAGDGN